MGIIVQKYGGSSVADLEKLNIVAERIIKEKNNNNKIVVVVSAQGKMTDKLICEEKEITDEAVKREHDVLVSVGEQITIAKLSILLNKLGHKAVSLTGWQVPIITDSNFTDSTIKYIENKKILKFLDDEYIVIVAGFQGIDEDGNITTLGRGGSDTTAVALAASLNAEKCEIFTDVDGIYTSDPNVDKNARKIDEISYEYMLKMSLEGAKVLHSKCVEIGKKYNVPIYVKSTFNANGNGTLVKSN